jgi:hypothetical protein
MHSLQTNDGLPDAYDLKLTPPLKKFKINTQIKNYFVSLTNTKTPIHDPNSHGVKITNLAKITSLRRKLTSLARQLS